MAFTTVTTWTVGFMAIAAKLNAQLRDNLLDRKGQSGTIVYNDSITLADMDGAPVGILMIINKGGVIYLRDIGDTTDAKVSFSSIPTGTSSSTIAIGNHTH